MQKSGRRTPQRPVYRVKECGAAATKRLCDLNLDDITGVDLIARLKCDPILSGTCVLLITSEMDVESLSYIKTEGIHYLLKPFSSEDLKRKIDKVME